MYYLLIKVVFAAPHLSFVPTFEHLLAINPLDIENQDDIFKAFAPSLPEQFECLIGALGDASKANGMANEWTKFQPQFKQHLDAWKQCASGSNKLKIILYVPLWPHLRNVYPHIDF